MCSGPAPLADIEDWIKTYFNLRLTDGEIVEHLIEHYDTDKYSLGCVYQCRHYTSCWTVGCGCGMTGGLGITGGSTRRSMGYGRKPGGIQEIVVVPLGNRIL